MKNLKKFRVAHGFTQVALAGIMGVTQSVIADWEAGRNMPSAEKLPKLADVLDCTIDALYGRTVSCNSESDGAAS